jgi:hypothetical protein
MADDTGVPIGVAAARLGVTASTLRSWGRRYDVVPSLRTAGGHRRYSARDLQVLDDLAARVRVGVAPAVAAAEARARSGEQPGRDRAATSAPAVARRGAGPGGRVLAVPGADADARGLARAAAQLDLEGAEEVMISTLRERGVVRTWETLMRPVLVAAGLHWARTGQGVEVEHVLSEAAIGALRRRRAELPDPLAHPPVVLAAAPDDQHTLTLQALAVGLAELRRPARVIGAQVPYPALATVMRRTRPAAVFVSCVVQGGADPRTLAASLPRTRPPIPVVIGGGGWPPATPAGLTHAADLTGALELLTGTSLPEPV